MSLEPCARCHRPGSVGNAQGFLPLRGQAVHAEEAQIAATLALVDEQHTANLIAYWAALTEAPFKGNAKTDAISDLIEARLGLGSAA